MERRPIIAGNWKMNLTNSESIKFLDQIFQMSLSDNVEKNYICTKFIFKRYDRKGNYKWNYCRGRELLLWR